tara:strand:- start:238 stop:1605 length:1368 start_codon:yes stop_codon:yes gene_type:complete
MKDLLMGFRVSGGCFVFSSSEFSVSSGIKNITNVFSISDFTRIKVVRGGILSDNIELDGKVIGKFNRRSIDPWNQIFDEINTVFETYFEKTLEQREIEEVVEEERLKDEEKEKKEETYLSGDTEFILKAAGPNKLKVVVLIKEMTGWELAEAKAAMDAAPTTLAVDLTEFDAETYLFLFEEEGAEVEILTKSQREELDFFKNINKRIDLVDTALKKISVLVIPSIAEYKSNVVEHEDVISKKAGDNQLYSFLKVYSFLNEFRNRIRVDQSELSNGIDVEQIKYEAQMRQGNKVSKQNLEDIIATLDGRKGSTFKFKLETVLTLGENMTASMEAQIITLEFYHSMANAMLIYYLEDKKIRYFELYEAFEKMGVFDSTWEKNILSKLESIDIRLVNIDGQLTELNLNFEALADASVSIVSELQNINSSFITNNMLTAITAHQTWRINRNTKSLRGDS